MALNYEQAGVSVNRGEALIEWLKTESTPSPHADKVVSGIGGFAALFKASFSHMEDPCLVSSTDGVGTKLRLAIDFNEVQGVAQDLVAMCVNDLLCVGSDPLFFLDYYACGKLDLNLAKEFLSGLKKACLQADCALIGGETAEMPGMYNEKDFDCAGFALGVVDNKKSWGRHKTEKNDRFIGVSSGGFHSNGYSLLRKLFESDIEEYKDTLLKPTEIYTPLVQKIKSEKINVHGACHITGGGIDNLLRVLPEGLALDLKPWDIPKNFLEAKKRGSLSLLELLKIFNCGIGFVFVVPKSEVERTFELIESCGYKSFDLGSVVQGEKKILFPQEFLV